jgi:beta-N-acetylhexosaminidase
MMLGMPPDLCEAVHRCLILGWPVPAVTDELKRRVERGLGGVILHTRNVAGAEELRAVTDELRAIRPDVLVAVDQEGGGIGHLARAGAPDTPGNWALGVVDDTSLTAKVATSLANHLAGLGVSVSYSPVADVQQEQSNPIIRTRSFGSDPRLVARHVAAWTTATLDAGIAPCAKHFPGHGTTTMDSHLDKVVDHRDLSLLSEVDLVPFRAAVAAGVPQIMTAHVTYPVLDGLPATLSRRVLVDLLRGELGYRGVIVTDALEMKAIADHVGAEAGAWMALAAGADQLIIAEPDDGLHERCVAAVAAAVTDGSLAAERVVEAAERVAEMAARFAAPAPAVRAADPDPGLGAARRAVRRQLRIEPLVRPFVIDLFRPPKPALEWDRSNLVTHVRAVASGADGVGVTGGSVDVDDLLARAAGRPLVVATEDVGLHPWQRDARDALLAARPDALLVETGFPERAAAVHSYGRGRANLLAAAEVIAR